jgi:hypothetical protein
MLISFIDRVQVRVLNRFYFVNAIIAATFLDRDLRLTQASIALSAIAREFFHKAFQIVLLL